MCSKRNWHNVIETLEVNYEIDILDEEAMGLKDSFHNYMKENDTLLFPF